MLSSRRFASAAARLSAAHVDRPMPCMPQPGTFVVMKSESRATPAIAFAMPTCVDPVLHSPVVPSAQ